MNTTAAERILWEVSYDVTVCDMFGEPIERECFANRAEAEAALPRLMVEHDAPVATVHECRNPIRWEDFGYINHPGYRELLYSTAA